MKKKEKEKKNKCYIVLCHWKDENDEEVTILNNVTYPTIEEADLRSKSINELKAMMKP